MADDIHNRHEDNKPAPRNKSKTTQEVRDAHFRENGVDDQGRAPRNKVFDEQGKAHKRPTDEATE